jgi:magnesium-transporting ATPase (P-type)
MDVEMAMAKEADCNFEQTLWADLKVGDIIKLENDSWVPCDIVLLNTCLEEGMCYIQTANLDG